MRLAISLAMKGIGKTSPNPLVGAVIVHQDKVIGEGYHEFFGGPHAEVNAIASVEDTSLLRESTLYVTLEPCSHFGKTPPCADLVCSHHFKRVVIGMKDPNSKVAGKGIDQLIKNGIDTTVGILEEECRFLNKGFICFHERKRPYITLKWAETKDGYLDDHGNPIRISNAESDKVVQELRNEYQSILIGRQTVINDNPRLTCRAENGTHPIRIILDSNLEINGDFHIFNNVATTWFLNRIKNAQEGHTRYIQIDSMEIRDIISALYNEGIVSVLVEGGKRVLDSFLTSGIWDEALKIKGDVLTNGGTKAPLVDIEATEHRFVGSDEHFIYLNK